MPARALTFTPSPSPTCLRHIYVYDPFFHVHMKCENLFSRVIFPACKMFFYCSPCCALACFSFSSKLLRHSSMAHGYLIIRGLNFSFPKMRASNWRYLVYLINYATYSRRVLFGGRKVVDKPFWFGIKFSSCQCDWTDWCFRESQRRGDVLNPLGFNLLISLTDLDGRHVSNISIFNLVNVPAKHSSRVYSNKQPLTLQPTTK